jgi:lipopolysaccharide transport system ATP-binding protein
LITDEVLAVGDESFQKKCIRWIEAFLANGNSLLMVSHSMYMVQKLCHRALWLHDGRVQMQGDVFDVTQSYLTWHETKAGVEKLVRQQEQGQSGEYRIAHFELSGEDERGQSELRTGDNLDVTMDLVSPDGRPPVAAFGIVRADGSAIYGVVSDFDNAKAEPIGNGKYRFIIRFHDLPLLPGTYSVRGHAMDPEGLRFSDTAEKEFRIRGKCRELGHVQLPHQWLQGNSYIQDQDGNPVEPSGE